jgi:hypothetical protein
MPKSEKRPRQPKSQNTEVDDLAALLENAEVFSRVRDEILVEMSRRIESLRSISLCKKSPLDAHRITREEKVDQLANQQPTREAWYELQLCADLAAPLIRDNAGSRQVRLYQEVREKYLPNLIAKLERSIEAVKAAANPALKKGKGIEKDFKDAFGISESNVFGGAKYAYYAVLAKSILDRSLGCADDVWDTCESGAVLTIAFGSKMQTMQAVRAGKGTCEKIMAQGERLYQQSWNISALKMALEKAGQPLEELAVEIQEIMDGKPRSAGSNIEYSADYSAASWNGKDFTFSPLQGVVCQIFHEEWLKTNKPMLLKIDEIKALAVKKKLPSNIPTLGRLFNKHPFWGSVIQNAKPLRKGLYKYDPQQR